MKDNACSACFSLPEEKKRMEFMPFRLTAGKRRGYNVFCCICLSGGVRMTEKKTGLVLEGGGVRGIYTAGVLDVFMERGLTGFDGVIGVSAGAIHACSYLSGQKGRSIRYYRKYVSDPRFMSLRSD